MEVTLPSGNTATFRDQFMRGDRREARRGMKFVTAADGSRIADGAFLDDLSGRVITLMLVNWSFDQPLPRNAGTGELAQQILDKVLTEEDAQAMDIAVRPWVDRVLTMGRDDNVFTHSGTGVRVTVSDPDDAAKLVASGEFKAVEAAGPKSRQNAIGTSSSESPELSGPTATE